MKCSATRFTAALALIVVWGAVLSLQNGTFHLIEFLSQMEAVLPVITQRCIEWGSGGIFATLGVLSTISLLVGEITMQRPASRLYVQVSLLILWLLAFSVYLIALVMPMSRVTAKVGGETEDFPIMGIEPSASGYSAGALLVFNQGVPEGESAQSMVNTYKGPEFEKVVEQEFTRVWQEEMNSANPPQSPEPDSYYFEVDGNFIKVFGWSEDPETAMLKANTVARAAEVYSEKISTQKSLEAVSWLQDVEKKEVAKLDELDQQLRDLRTANVEGEELQAVRTARAHQEAVVSSLRSRIEQERVRHESEQPDVRILEFATSALAEQ